MMLTLFRTNNEALALNHLPQVIMLDLVEKVTEIVLRYVKHGPSWTIHFKNLLHCVMRCLIFAISVSICAEDLETFFF